MPRELMMPRYLTSRVPRPGTGTHDSHRVFTTDDECRFLEHVGKWQSVRRDDRAFLLRQYLKAAGLRQDWGQIDKKQALAYALDALLREGGHVCAEEV